MLMSSMNIGQEFLPLPLILDRSCILSQNFKNKFALMFLKKKKIFFGKQNLTFFFIFKNV